MENKHVAHWIFYTAVYYNKPLKYSVCSCCAQPVDGWVIDFSYCPHCASEMSEEPAYLNGGKIEE